MINYLIVSLKKDHLPYKAMFSLQKYMDFSFEDPSMFVET